MSDKYDLEQDLDLDLDFENTEELSGHYDHSPVETIKVEPLVEDVNKDVNKEDLYDMQSLMVMLITAGMKQANEKGIYPEKVIQQAMTLLKNNDIHVKTEEADALKSVMQQFQSAGKNSSKERKTSAMEANKIN